MSAEYIYVVYQIETHPDRFWELCKAFKTREQAERVAKKMQEDPANQIKGYGTGRRFYDYEVVEVPVGGGDEDDLDE